MYLHGLHNYGQIHSHILYTFTNLFVISNSFGGVAQCQMTNNHDET